MNSLFKGLPIKTDVLREWIDRIKVGDQAAAAELVRHFEPEIRRFVRVRLTDPKLQRFLDSMDIVQSVMGRFFQRIQSDRLHVEHPLQLLRLLTTMARNSLLDHVRRAKVRRDVSGAGGEQELQYVADRRIGQTELVEQAELVALVRGRLSSDEQQALDRWLLSDGWEQMSQDIGCEPDAIRKKVSRAIDRASKELGLLENDDG